ncbi:MULTISPECIES: type II toxin-antitoxin system VapC family toxin [unclassified Methanoregula]|uniref:type II toxin-antitoxin system VapC family toxin n=1 Tax=unclassified Methanoregula TaxID=2649730 RepID=UPI0009CB502D|nr:MULTISPECIES: PIN domain-containing protein [unclassified Methanoregula]OPX61775.1 MAG: tRNA(fMet)-specific endonuclease VapC [Methanoregula sp. PtaB.Bin085]OPY33916.1 MAG: tRNA(fMet)-specific endonuclease VapC [Methanoregula sp. PtaU1.Bin006]
MTGPGILVDTFTWIEIFQNSPWGRKALVCIEENSPVAVSVLTLYELRYRISDFFSREKIDSLIGIVVNHAEVIPVDTDIAILAGAIKADRKKNGSGMGAMDCMILATARLYSLKILSGDRHFAGLEECLEITEGRQ